MSDDDLGLTDSQPTAPGTPAERLRELLERLLDEFDLDGTIEVEEGEEELRASIDGDDLGAMIGNHGTTIDAIQHLA
ncbi:MAG: hypothetical protein QOG63_776, partial [Thermoleophilaceae bacterium]|nr:hypothetical protein [Thermoleophilaceae bacterium]